MCILVQTEGKELPELEVKELSDSMEDYENFMQALTEVSPCRLNLRKLRAEQNEANSLEILTDISGLFFII